MPVGRSSNVSFQFDGILVSHCLYVMDNLAMDEKVVLGMDFLVEYGVFIDMGSNTVTIPRLNNHRPWSSVMELTQDASICIDPHKTATVMLLPLDKAQLPNLNTIGYVHAHYQMALCFGMESNKSKEAVSCLGNQFL